jgi:hypothetical protein
MNKIKESRTYYDYLCDTPNREYRMNSSIPRFFVWFIWNRLCGFKQIVCRYTICSWRKHKLIEGLGYGGPDHGVYGAECKRCGAYFEHTLY